MISKYFGLFQKATQTCGLDGRIALISALILTVSIFISKFNVFISISIVLFILIFNRKSIYSILASLPFLALFFISIVIFGGTESILLSVLAMILVGSGIIYSAGTRNILAAMLYFKFPKKVALSLFLSLRLFQIYIQDLKNVSEILSLSGDGKLSYYRKLLKTFVSVAILRCVAISETIYSRDIDFEMIIEFKPNKKDYFLLAFSIAIVVVSVLLRLNIFAILPLHC